MRRITAISNQKGGVGKTTTAVNLAASLAAEGQRVLLIDCDPQGNASSGLGIADRSRDGSLYPVLFGEATIDEVVQPTEMQQLKLVRSSRDLAGVEAELADADDRLLRLKRALVPERDRYDFIILDSPPSLGVLTLNALVAADQVVVPMQPEYYALEGLSDLRGTIDRVRATLNPPLELHGVLLTMYDPRNNLATQVADEVRKHFHVFDTVIPRNIRLAEAPSYGKPVILYDATSRGSHGYTSLAREMLGQPPGGNAVEAVEAVG